MQSTLLGSAGAAIALAAFAAPALGQGNTIYYDDIIVTATKRAQALSDVPIAVSAVSGDALANTGAADIRQLDQLSPSLLVSSTASEANSTGVRVRGIGTVGDNAGLESSVAVFIDGVYRNRSGTALTELGPVERIEVLRGPQGTLFGRNASAGLINVITKKPEFELGGNAELSYGNYNYWRVAGGITGALAGDTLAGRLDGVFVKRDGFIKDVISGIDHNDRNRWLLRGQLLFTPNDALSIRVIGDYGKRDESCCASVFMPFQYATVQNGALNISRNSPIVGIVRGLGGTISDDWTARKTSVTPGLTFDQDVKDWGLSAEAEWNMGDITLTSITAYRDWHSVREQDLDYTNLDILRAQGIDTRFRTFSQELRLHGEAFDNRLDWLVGGYFAHEKLDYTSTNRFGADANRFGDCLVAANLAGSAAAIGINGLLSVGAPGCINPAVAAAIPNIPQLAALRAPARLWAGLTIPGLYGYDAVAAAAGRPGAKISNTGIVADVYNQTSRNFAFFTHNVIDLIPDALSLTLGLRYTNERKELDVSFAGDNSLCAAIASNPALAALAAYPCAVNYVPNYTGHSVKNEDEWTGTVVLSHKPSARTMVYASYARGYKAGGFNLDRSSFSTGAIDLEKLKFAPELVNSFEIGAKLDFNNARINIAAFHAMFDQFQLNTFNGVAYVVENIQSCKNSLGGGDRDFAGLPRGADPVITPGSTAGRTLAEAAATGACDSKSVQPGVLSTGLELEAALFPVNHVAINLGLTWSNTRYRKELVGHGGKPLTPALFNLAGNRMSNAPEFVQTGSLTWTPPINDRLTGLFYLDYRYQSRMRNGSDLFPEKETGDVVVVNGRIGLTGPDSRWAIEGWVQNLFNVTYTQIGFNSPLMGSGTTAQTVRGGPAATTLFGSFLAEPRTFGVTVRTKF